MGERIKNEKKMPDRLVVRSQKREPLSARVKSNTKQILTDSELQVGTSLSDLAAAIFDDYADWLRSKKQGNKNA